MKILAETRMLEGLELQSQQTCGEQGDTLALVYFTVHLIQDLVCWESRYVNPSVKTYMIYIWHGLKVPVSNLAIYPSYCF